MLFSSARFDAAQCRCRLPTDAPKAAAPLIDDSATLAVLRSPAVEGALKATVLFAVVLVIAVLAFITQASAACAWVLWVKYELVNFNRRGIESDESPRVPRRLGYVSVTSSAAAAWRL